MLLLLRVLFKIVIWKSFRGMRVVKSTCHREFLSQRNFKLLLSLVSYSTFSCWAKEPSKRPPFTRIAHILQHLVQVNWLTCLTLVNPLSLMLYIFLLYDWLPGWARWSLSHFNISFIDQACSVMMAGYRPRSFFYVFMDLDFISVHKHTKKELGQYPAILTSRLVNNPYSINNVLMSSCVSFQL